MFTFSRIFYCVTLLVTFPDLICYLNSNHSNNLSELLPEGLTRVTPLAIMASVPPRSVLITGCNRGIGLELVKQFLGHPTPPEVLIATCRNPDKAEDLQALVKSHPDRLKILPLEMTSELHCMYVRILFRVG